MTPVVVMYALKNRSGKTRVGITTSKKIGNAVKRNRSRRIIREAWREVQPFAKKGMDYVFVARGKTPYAKTQDIHKQMVIQMKKSGFYKNDGA